MYRSTIALTAILLTANVASAGQIITTPVQKKKITAVQRFPRHGQVNQRAQRQRSNRYHHQSGYQAYNTHPQTNGQVSYNTNHHYNNANTYDYTNHYSNTYGQAYGQTNQYDQSYYPQNQCGHGCGQQHYRPLPPRVIAMRRQWIHTLRNVKRSLNNCYCTNEAANQLRNLIHCVRTCRPSQFNRQLIRRLQFVTMGLRGHNACVHSVQDQLRSIIWDIKATIR